MEGLGLLLLLWIISTIFEKVRDAQRKAPGAEPPLPRPPRGGRVERGRRRPPVAPLPPTPAESAEEEGGRLERIFDSWPDWPGPATGRGPRRRSRGAQSEAEPELAIDGWRWSSRRGSPTIGMKGRRNDPAVIEAGGAARADQDGPHRCDKMIRSPPPAARTGPRWRGAKGDCREAFVWKEIDKPVGMRRPTEALGGPYRGPFSCSWQPAWSAGGSVWRRASCPSARPSVCPSCQTPARNSPSPPGSPFLPPDVPRSHGSGPEPLRGPCRPRRSARFPGASGPGDHRYSGSRRRRDR
jgi:hypothetical protein